MSAPLPPPLREAERLAELYRYEILDSPPEKKLDDIVHLAAYICNTPISLISLVDSDRQWFKSKVGLTATETSRYIAFCSHTILGNDLLIVPDALADERFMNNPLVTGEPHVRFYCGAPLITPDGYRIGTLNVIDHVPRDLSAEQLEAIRVLSRQVMDHLTLDRKHRELIRAVNERQRAEGALQRNEAKFRALSETNSSGIYIYSEDRILYANPAAMTITGFQQDELLTMSLQGLAHPSFQGQVHAYVRAIQGAKVVPARFEFLIVRKDGEIRWIDFTSTSIEFEGWPAKVGIAFDITDRKHAEELNTQQRKFFEQVLMNRPLAETMDSLVRSIEPLSNGGICSVLLAHTETGTLHSGAVSTLPEAYNREVEGLPIGPANGSCGTAAYRKSAVVVTDIATDPLWAPWPEARDLALRYGLQSCTSVPVLDAQGDVLGTYAMYFRAARRPTKFEMDLLQTASQALSIAIGLTRTEEALKQSEERFRLVALASNDVLWDWNLATHEFWWSPNAAKKFGHDPSAEPGIEAWTGRLHSDDRNRILHSLEDTMKGLEESWVGEYRLRLADSSYGFCMHRGQIVRDATGKPLRMIGAILDVTEAKQAYASLNDAYARLQTMSREVQSAEENERRRLSRELHDEFGQLLSAIKFNLNDIGEGLLKIRSPRAIALRRDIRSATDTVDRLFVSFREVLAALRPATLEVLGLVQSIQTVVDEMRGRTGIRCSVTTNRDDIGVLCGPDVEGTLYRMAQELLTNVVRHAEATASTVTLEYADGWVKLTVRDDGVGFAAHQRPQEDRFGIRGIQERAEILGGNITIRSEPGMGTDVTVRLPCPPTEASGGTVAATRKPKPPTDRKRRKHGGGGTVGA